MTSHCNSCLPINRNSIVISINNAHTTWRAAVNLAFHVNYCCGVLPELGPELHVDGFSAAICRFGAARSPSQISESLRQIILRLYDKHLAADGKALNYEALKKDPVFKTYVNATAELQKVDVASLSREERMAFFINIYNAVVVHALAVFGPASNLKQR